MPLASRLRCPETEDAGEEGEILGMRAFRLLGRRPEGVAGAAEDLEELADDRASLQTSPRGRFQPLRLRRIPPPGGSELKPQAHTRQDCREAGELGIALL